MQSNIIINSIGWVCVSRGGGRGGERKGWGEMNWMWLTDVGFRWTKWGGGGDVWSVHWNYCSPCAAGLYTDPDSYIHWIDKTSYESADAADPNTHPPDRHQHDDELMCVNRKVDLNGCSSERWGKIRHFCINRDVFGDPGVLHWFFFLLFLGCVLLI